MTFGRLLSYKNNRKKVKDMSKQIEYYGTLGPACCQQQILCRMLEAGMTGIRLNLSHKSLVESSEWLKEYQKAAKKLGKSVELLIDLMGPEIRIGTLDHPLELEEGETVLLNQIPIPQVIEEKLKPGMCLQLDDGKIEIEIEEDEKDGFLTGKVLRGGKLVSRKSLAVPGLEIQNPTLTKQDHENLREAVSYGVTAVMLPFVRGKEDLICLKEALNKYGAEKIRVFAKIENLKGVENLEELLPYCDCVVIARGDLGNVVPLTRLPVIQQKISAVCKKAKKPFMVVTQMLNSMIINPVPTRAEVNDIFHAIADGASSVMLTGETAAGAYPVEAMKNLVETGEEAVKWLTELKKEMDDKNR